MPKKKRKKGHSKGKHKRAARRRNLDKGKVPLVVLERRLKKLHKIVDDRGGSLPAGYA